MKIERVKKNEKLQFFNILFRDLDQIKKTLLWQKVIISKHSDLKKNKFKST